MSLNPLICVRSIGLSLFNNTILNPTHTGIYLVSPIINYYRFVRNSKKIRPLEVVVEGLDHGSIVLFSEIS